MVARTVSDIMEKIEIDKDKPLNPGDRIEMYFRSTSMVWIKAAQIALIEYRLAGRKDFQILSWSLAGPNTVIFTVRINKTNPVIVTAAIIGVAIIGAGVVAWLTLDKVLQIIESPTSKVMAGGAIVAAIVGLLVLIKK